MHVIRNTEEIRKFIGEKKTAVALGAVDGPPIGRYRGIRTAGGKGAVLQKKRGGEEEAGQP